MDHAHSTSTPATDPVVALLIGQRARFLSFLERRVESSAAAEEILQDAFAKGLEKREQLHDDESAVAWFYRLLRNAVVDHYRHRGAEARALEVQARDVDDAFEPEAVRTICACLYDVLPLLKDDQRGLVEAVDLQGRPVGEVAVELGITPGAARVRLHRARQALKAQLERVCNVCATHGCLDCTCTPSP